jgi:crossover junction endodeoxyribonuclease RusA
MMQSNKLLRELMLPYPPSVNHYWKHFRGRTIIGAVGRKYHRDVAEQLGEIGKPLDCRLAVEVYCWMPDRRMRDIDNVAKCALDSLTKVGIWCDDNQIDRLVLERCGVCSPGWLDVRIFEMPDWAKPKKGKR